MLDTLRKSAGSWVVKVFLGLLVLSFAAWGIGDIFRVSPDTAVAEVGDAEIGQATFLDSFNRDLQRLQQRMGGGIDAEQARRMGLAQQTLERLVTQALYDEASRALGLTVSDAAIRQEIMANPAFKDELGRFSAARFEQVLRQNGYSEQSYVAARRQELARAQLFDSIVAGAHVPPPLAERFYRHQHQQRVLQVLRVPHDSVQVLSTPDESILAKFHQDHAARYTAPELRALSFIVVRPEDLKDEVAVDPSDVRTSYERRAAEFAVPETRQVEQILVAEEPLARQIAQRLEAGNDFHAVAQELAGQTPADLKLGSVTREELPEAVREAVFGLAEGETSAPVQSPFGWHVFRVTEVSPGRQQGFEEVRGQIEDQLRLERAYEAMADLAIRIEDSLASGATLEETAEQLNLQVRKVAATDASGRDIEGEPVEALPEMAGFLETAFEMAVGEEPLLREGENGSRYVLRVDAIEAPKLRPLDEVRQRVLDDWQAEVRRSTAAAKAKALAEEARSGKTFEGLTRSAGYRSLTTAPLTRAEMSEKAGLGAGAVEAAFDLKPGEIGTGVSAQDDAAVVFRLEEIVIAKPAEHPEAVDELRQGLRGLLVVDLLEQYRQGLRESIGVEINPRAVESLFQ